MFVCGPAEDIDLAGVPVCDVLICKIPFVFICDFNEKEFNFSGSLIL